MIEKGLHFIKNDIWRLRLRDLPRPRSILIKHLRVVLLALRGFDEDKCQLRASALTFYTLLSIVPIAAMAFGVAKGFGFEKHLERQIMQGFAGQEEVATNIINFSNRLLENTRGGLVAGIGVAALFWVVIKVLGNIERSFDDIWGIKEMRPIGRKFSDYLSIMLLCPILIILSSSATVFITTQIRALTQSVEFLGFVASIILSGVRLVPYLFIWVLFTFIYIFMPNTKVNFKSALLAGIVSGTLYVVAPWGYINFQIGVARYNAIYGSFAALPIFLVWLQISWLITLFGAELSFAHQNVDTYEFEPDALQASNRLKKLFALRVTNFIVKNFDEGRAPLSDNRISHELEMPIRIVRDILFDLEKEGIVAKRSSEPHQEETYLPARNIENLRVKDIIDALEKKGINAMPALGSEEMDRLSGTLDDFDRAIAESPGNVVLKNI